MATRAFEVSGDLLAHLVDSIENGDFEMASNDIAMRGKHSQAWVFRCGRCSHSDTYESNTGRVNAVQATRWAREEGWSFKVNGGWICPRCNKI
ncbi:MAG: hypothetical protein ABI324_19665 [Ktedonobacteraceae bacterium]